MSVPVPDPEVLWRWLPVGYAITVALEAPVMAAGLTRHTISQRLAAALWLTAVTYPIVAVALPLLLWPRAPYAVYAVVAETFATTAECLLFRVAWRGTRRDLLVVALANLTSAVVGTVITTR